VDWRRDWDGERRSPGDASGAPPQPESPRSGSPKWESRVRSAERSISGGLAAIANRQGARQGTRATARELEAGLSRAVSPLLSRSRDASPERGDGAPRLLDFGFDSGGRGGGVPTVGMPTVGTPEPGVSAIAALSDVGMRTGPGPGPGPDPGPLRVREGQRRPFGPSAAQLSPEDVAEQLRLLVLLRKAGAELVRLQAEAVGDTMDAPARGRLDFAASSVGDRPEPEVIEELWLPKKHCEGEFKLQHARSREVGGRLEALRALKKEADALLQPGGWGGGVAGGSVEPFGMPATPAASPALSALSARSPLYTPVKVYGPPPTPQVEGFFPAERFEGAQRGYIFGRGAAGLGYYPDQHGGLARSSPLPGRVGPDGKWRAQVTTQGLKRLEQLSRLQTLKLQAEALFF